MPENQNFSHCSCAAEKVDYRVNVFHDLLQGACNMLDTITDANSFIIKRALMQPWTQAEA
jgi:hypothetical protein